MGLISLFKPKFVPVPCQLCLKEFNALNKYNSIYLGDMKMRKEYNKPRIVCTECLLKLIKGDLDRFGGRAVFTEPIIEIYGFEKLTDCTFPEEQGIPLSTYLPPLGTKCHKCSSYAKFAWVDESAIDDDKSIKTNAYFDRANNSEYEYLCSIHLIETFSNALKKNKIIFRDIYPVVGNDDGICA